MARALGHTKHVRAPSPPIMRGVIYIFIAFVALGSGFFIWLDRQSEPTQLDNVVMPNGSKMLPKKPANQAVVAYKPKSTQKPFVITMPFVSQAPFGNWADPRQEDGCEEASALMAMRWRERKTLTPTQGLEQILAMSKFEEDTYGTYHDTSAQDTVDRIFSGYFKYGGAYVKYSITKDDILKTLDQGKLVIVPANGQKLANPNYTPPGPLEHMLVIKGYDWKTKEFITNDPGTRRGEGYRYRMDVMMKSIRDYPTGHGEPFTGGEPSAMIVVSKNK